MVLKIVNTSYSIFFKNNKKIYERKLGVTNTIDSKCKKENWI